VSVLEVAARRPVLSRATVSLPLAALWSLFAAANLAQWRATHAPLGLGATALELGAVVLFVIRRAPLDTSRSPVAWAAAAIGTFGMIGARPAFAPVGGLEAVYVAVQVCGALVAAAAMVALGRSFGIVPANRGVRTGGPYRFVRHPLYSGYLITELGYVLENPSVRNSVLLAAVVTVQAVRTVAEERFLAADPAYRRYCERVRRRVVPFVF
jgi:protein-S-isoprenylcysteine O-methyltransferase Ste14